MKTITKEGIVKFAKNGVKYVTPVLVAILYNRSVTDALGEVKYIGNVEYDDAVKVITNSSMYSGDKCEMIELLKTGQGSEYYRSIISIVRSTMYSSDKLKMIKTINSKEEE